ncbi:DUF192 domain-containing protein (plasmid) [Pseudomonas sp. FeN3W]|nr:DUF192 domain-containing protein [Pseudomonas sp. FeN3W]
MSFSWLKFIILLSAAWFIGQTNAEPMITWDQTNIVINDRVFKLRVADTELKRQKGLMNVTEMPLDAGMLFVFDVPGKYCMWMKNTKIPLTVAYLDKDGNFIDRYDMTPNDLTAHCTSGEAKYAVEVNQGVI